MISESCSQSNKLRNEEQIIAGYPIDGAMGNSGGGRARKLSVVCLHSNAINARGILVTIFHCGQPPSPSMVLVLLERHCPTSYSNIH